MDVAVTIHDNYRIELKVNYPLLRRAEKASYELGLYLFAPISLGINPATYSKEQLYSDLQTYIRVKTPSIPLNQLANGAETPLGRLCAIIESMVRQPVRWFILSIRFERFIMSYLRLCRGLGDSVPA